MTILIVEDEPLAGQNLKKLILRYDPEQQILPALSTVEDAVALLKTLTPDLIFMDIELNDGMSFEIFDKVEVKSPVVFTTAYSEFALKAFKFPGVHYLLKPITYEMIEEAFQNYERMKNIITPAESIRDIDNLFHQRYKSRFLVPFAGKLIPLEVADIAYFVTEGNYAYLVTHLNKRYIQSYNLTQLENMLDPGLFFRLNRQYLVHKKAIKAIEPYTKGQIAVSLHPPTPRLEIVSRKYTPVLKEWLNR